MPPQTATCYATNCASSPVTSSSEVHLTRLKHICKRLLKIAQRYIPKTVLAYSDTDDLVKCAKLLHSMGVDVEVDSGLAAKYAAVDPDEIVVNSAAYRALKQKAIAGLATVADMGEKMTATGSREYQKGVREGYQRASAVAIAFLEDIQNGD